MATAVITQPAPSPFDPGQGVPGDPRSRVGHMKELFKISSKYMQDNWWNELSEVYRAIRCRTEPIMVKDPKTGQKVEDKNRTNVCMPELNLIVRRKTARLTANPPTLNYYVPGDDPDLLAERLTARAYYEYDRSGEAFELRRGVQQAMMFGYTYFKTYFDTVDVVRQMRYQREKMRDRATVMNMQGADPEEITQAVALQGEQMSDQEVASAISQHGSELRGPMPTTQYEGPVTKTRFIGDILLEPGCLTSNDSAFVFEDYKETALWLTKMAAKTYSDPESGQQVKVFDPGACDDLLAQNIDIQDGTSSLGYDSHDNLKRLLRDAIQQNQPYVANRLMPQKRFRITEFHSPDKDGRLWIEYMGNDSVYLGKQPYPFDFCGRWVYTEYVPWPDLIGAIGDSSPRLLRFLHKMHNAAVGQRNDLITNILRRRYKVASEADIPDEQVHRTFGSFLVMPQGDMNAIQEFVEQDVPQSAWETEAQIKSEMMQAEPVIGGVDSGSSFNPQAGKTATTSILQAKSSDVLIQFEIDGLNLCLKELGEKKLEIHRQVADSPIPVPNRPQYVKTEGLTQRYGKTSLITIDPYEIQDPLIQVEPVAGSTLAVDDELRTSKIYQIYQMAENDPLVWDKFAAAKLVLTTVKGVGDTSQLLKQAPPPPPPVMPKVAVNVQVKYDELTPDIKAQLLGAGGLQVTPDTMNEMNAEQTIKGLPKVSKAADAAANLASPAHPVAGAGLLASQTGKVGKEVNGAP